MEYPKLTSEQSFLLSRLAEKLGTNKDWLYKLIDFESGWKPGAKNPYSSARGLIQFTDTTARGLGYKDSADLIDKNQTINDQLDFPVYEYLKKYAPFPSQQSLTMAIFYPKYRYRSVSPDTLFPDTVRSVNPGINTPADYIKKIFGASWVAPGAGAGVITLLIIGGFVLYNYLQKG